MKLTDHLPYVCHKDTIEEVIYALMAKLKEEYPDDDMGKLTTLSIKEFPRHHLVQEWTIVALKFENEQYACADLIEEVQKAILRKTMCN